MNDIITQSIHYSVDLAVKAAVDAAVTEAQAKVEKSIRAKTAQIAVDVSNFYTIETCGDRIVITVRHLPAANGAEQGGNFHRDHPKYPGQP